MAAIATKRFMKDVGVMKLEVGKGIIEKLDINENVFGDHKIILLGQKGTYYENGRFALKFNISKEYPFKPPNIIFETPIYHPNISKDGYICIDILKNNWNAGIDLLSTFNSILVLLQIPNPDDPLRPSIANIYKTDKKQYASEAKASVEKYSKSVCI
uniref:UBC core domain-containing protein n=1 Tax=viral metagenome TaxID=1070528 RepID=A0A6C0EB72_9ZZZZ